MFKLNKTLAIISIFLISLCVISAASAADNDSDIDVISEIEDADVISVETDDEALSTDVVENENVVADGNGTGFNITQYTNMTGGNGTGFNISQYTNMTGGNGTGMDMSQWMNMTGGNGTGMDMSQWMNMFGGSQDKINSTDLTTYYSKTTTFKVTVYNGNKTVTSGNVVFTINNKDYVGRIGSDGVASVDLKKLAPGEYAIFSEYGNASVKNKITVKKSLFTNNVKVKSKKGGKFKVKILNSEGKAAAKKTVKIKFEGKTYKIKANKKGVATFNIPKKLKVGKHVIKTSYQGLTLKNKVTVKK